MPCGYVRTTALRIRHRVSPRAAQWSQVLSKCPADLRRGLSSSKIWLFQKSNLVAYWMHLHNCRCFQEHLTMLLQSLRALYLAPGGYGSIQKYLEAMVRLPGVSGRIVCGFQTDLHFADDHGLRVHLQTRSITAFKCISKPARLRPPSLHHHGLQVHLQTRLITASKCISKLARLRPRSASLSSLVHGAVKGWS